MVAEVRRGRVIKKVFRRGTGKGMSQKSLEGRMEVPLSKIKQRREGMGSHWWGQGMGEANMETSWVLECSISQFRRWLHGGVCVCVLYVYTYIYT